jgi:hypothetical protein
MRICQRLFVALAMFCTGAATSGVAHSANWLYCAPLDRYFPYPRTCPVPWRQVAPNGQANGGMVLPPRASAAPTATPSAPRPSFAPDPAAQQAAKAKQAALVAEQQKRDADAAAGRKQRKEAAEAAVADKKAKLEAQRQQDETQGFKETTISDIRVDYKSMGEDTRIVVTGLYSSLGQIAMLSEDYAGSSSIYIMADELPRETRKRILNCDGCRVTIWAHYGCTMTVLNQQTGAPCFVADRLRMGGYGLVDDE